MSEQHSVGDLFNNAWEVSDYAITVEIMAVWVDEEDDNEVHYIIKCREVTPDKYGKRVGAWMWEEDVDLVSHGHLEKYYEKGRHND